PKDEQRITRLELLLWTTYLDESNPLVDFAGRMTPLSNLPQRLPIALPAAALMLTALAAGDLLLGLSFKRNRLIGLDRFVFAYALGTGIVSLYVLLAGLAGALVPWTVAVTGGLVLAGWG